jgi:hypothetical protein
VVDLVLTVCFFIILNAQTEGMWNQALFYTRAAASDYDDWEYVYGNKGWGFKHLIPLLKKVRVFTVYPL